MPKVTIDLDDDYYSHLKKLADKDDSSIVRYVKIAIKRRIEAEMSNIQLEIKEDSMRKSGDWIKKKAD